MATNDTPRKPDPMSIAERNRLDRLSVQIELPVGEYPSLERRYVLPRVFVRLKRKHGIALKQLLDGLDATEAKLANGSRVRNPPDAVLYLLEQYAAGHQEQADDGR